MSGLQLKFWGVRGSLPTPRTGHLAYGGNTACIEVQVPDSGGTLVIDAGTGLTGVGEALDRQNGGEPRSVHFLMTHFHWDHIQGLPLFAPLYDARNRFRFHAELPAAAIQETLEGQMSRPYFPVPFETLAAPREFVDMRGEEIRFGGLRVRSFRINHPQGACGYRLEAGNVVAVHVSDHEHGDARIDAGIRRQAEGADLLIYDAQYTPEEYLAKRGWGHSTHAEATRLARECGVRQLVLFHHDPSHDDERMRAIVATARRDFENTDAAREGSTVTL